jgi:hypothetical protein
MEMARSTDTSGLSTGAHHERRLSQTSSGAKSRQRKLANRRPKRKPAGPLKVVLKVDGEEVASGVVPVSAPFGFTANDCLDFGIDLGSPVGIEYYDQAPSKFNGSIEGARVVYLGSPSQVQEEKLETDGPIPAAD